LIRLRAMPDPIIPKPMNPTFISPSSFQVRDPH
jgi:hypothetical protein